MRHPFPSVVAVGSTVAAMLLALPGISIPSPESPSLEGLRAVAAIENLHALSASVFSGGQPQGLKAFAQLKRAGIRTIVSVDGARPDLEAATIHRLRYVHIPVGYDGISGDAQRMLTRVMQDCERPIFVHCHHGKHRGPAAAALCALIAGEADHQAALHFLEQAGTGREYGGLWRDVARFTPCPPGTTLPTLVEAAAPEPLAEVMLRIEERVEQLTDHLGKDEFSDQEFTDVQPHLQADEVAIILQEEFREASRLGRAESDLFRQMRNAEDTVRSLAAAARDRPADVPGWVQILKQQCRECHRKHRN